MEFGIEKCAMLVTVRGKEKVPDGKTIKGVKDGEGYKYLGVLETEEIKMKDTKEKTQSEYYRGVRKVMEIKLDSGNLSKALNN